MEQLSALRARGHTQRASPRGAGVTAPCPCARISLADLSPSVVLHMTEKLGYKNSDVVSTVLANRACHILAVYFLLNKKLERYLAGVSGVKAPGPGVPPGGVGPALLVQTKVRPSFPNAGSSSRTCFSPAPASLLRDFPDVVPPSCTGQTVRDPGLVPLWSPLPFPGTS